MKDPAASDSGKLRAVAYVAVVAEFILLLPALRACAHISSENAKAWLFSFFITTLFSLAVCTCVARQSSRITRIALPLIAAAIPLAPLVLALIIFSD